MSEAREITIGASAGATAVLAGYAFGGYPLAILAFGMVLLASAFVLAWARS